MSHARLPVLPSGSSLDRVAECLGSALLPQWPEGPGAWSDLGSAVGRYLELVAEKGHALAIREVPEEFRAECAALDLESLPVGPEYATEESFALHLRTGRTRRIPRPSNGGGGHRYAEAQLGPDELPMTLDVRSKVRPYVADYKRGWREGHHTHQLKAGAAVVLDVMRADTVVAEEIRLNETPARRIPHTWDAWDLEEWRAWWRDRFAFARSVTRVTDDMVRPGPHCRYCPAFLACPAKIGAVVDVQTGALVRNLNRVAAAGDIKGTLDLIDEAQAVITRMRLSLYGAAKEQPLDLDGVNQLGEVVTSTRNEVDGDAAWPIVKAHLGEYADAAASFTISAASIKRACEKAKAAAPERFKPPVAAMVRRILDDARTIGAVKLKVHKDVKVHPKKP